MDLTPHFPQRDAGRVIINSSANHELIGSGFSDQQQQQQPIKKPRPQNDQPSLKLNCPRCASTDTKFCYYNNYSLSQPRYFCKTCKRYWTEGGTLRNVPVGGGSRRNKRPSSASASSSSSKKSNSTHPDHHHHHQYWQDLTLNPNPNPNPPSLLAMPIQPMTAAGFSIPTTSQDQFLKQSLNFSLNYGYQNIGYGNLQLGFQENSSTYNNNIEGARVFFPHVIPNDDQFQQSTGQGEGSTTGGYWTEMLGGSGSGSW